MIVEAKAGFVVGTLAVVAAIGAWASETVAVALQSAGIVIETSVLVQLVMTAVIVGIAFGVVRNKVDAMAKRFDGFEATLNAVNRKVERFDERLNNHKDEIDRLRSSSPRRGGRESAPDGEDD